MRTENGTSPAGQRARRWVPTLLLVLALVAVGAPASGQPIARHAPWTDLDEASRQLADAQVAVLDARDALRAAETELDDLRLSTAAVAEDTLRIAEELTARQNRAINLAVEAYIAGGPLGDSLFVLDSHSANDYAYRSVLLTESANAVASSQQEYVSLREQASRDALELADRLSVLEAAVDAAKRAITDAEGALPHAEWVVAIAEINRAADELIERFGREDPSAAEWEELRWCEARGEYSTSTGNGYFGAYQFDVTTWVDMGGTGLPSDANPEEQDARARYLYGLRGSGYDRGGSWPVCGRFLPPE